MGDFLISAPEAAPPCHPDQGGGVVKKWSAVYFCIMLTVLVFIGWNIRAKNKEITSLKEQVVSLEKKGHSEREDTGKWFAGQREEYEKRIAQLEGSPEILQRITRLKGFKGISFSLVRIRAWNGRPEYRWNCVVTIFMKGDDEIFTGSSSNNIESSLSDTLMHIEEYRKVMCVALEEGK